MSQSPDRSEDRFRISVDTGGTFTDVVVSNDRGEMAVGKSFTTYDRVFDGFGSAVGNAVAQWGMTLERVLRQTDTIVYATTHATNAVVTGRTARTALLVTDGFEDTLAYREGGRIGAFDTRAAYPGPYIPRELTFGVAERMSSEGEVIEALKEQELDRLADCLIRTNVEAVAVMLLWSIANAEHERLLAEMLRRRLPTVPFSLSHEVNPIVREYRRASSVAIDASLKPHMRRHFKSFAGDLSMSGFLGNCLVVTLEGGVQTLECVAEKPILAVNSGPSMAPVAGASFAASNEEVVVCDIGGTTFDVSLVESGRLRRTRELWLGEPFTGELVGLASVAVKSVGAGGGSIARVDAGGLITVGPDSAGSTPGPAAYCKGGTEATITDAAVVLGYLDAKAIETKFMLDAEKARWAINNSVGIHLNMEPVRASAAIIKVAATKSAAAARQAIVEQGVDPRGTVVVACGGAGPLLGCFIANELEASKVIIPSNAGVLAAYGAHNADIVTEFNRPLAISSLSQNLEGLEQLLHKLRSEVDRFITDLDAERGKITLEYFTEARYPSQGWEIRVVLGQEFDGTQVQFDRAVAMFHQEHLKRNGVDDLNSAVEFMTWGVRVAIARETRKPNLGAVSDSTDIEARTAMVTFENAAYSTPRYKGTSLPHEWTADGPLIIDEPTTTVVVPPEWNVRRASDGSYHIVKTPLKGAHL